MSQQSQFKPGDRVRASIRVPNGITIRAGSVKAIIPDIHNCYWVMCDNEFHARCCGGEMLEIMTAKDEARLKERRQAAADNILLQGIYKDLSKR